MSRCFGCWLYVMSLAAIGCGKPTEPQNAAEKKAATNLKLFGVGYWSYLEKNQQPPRKFDDLKTVISSDEPIDFDHYQVVWDVDLKSITQPRTVLAYETVVPDKGGMVLFHEGDVERLSAEEFAKLPKAVAAKPLAERPVVAVTPAEYFDEFNNSNDKTGQKYEGKLIELVGVVKSLGRLSGQPELLVISPGKEQEEVRCFIAAGGEFWANVSKGQQVTVKGLARGSQGNPMLSDCQITNTGPATGVTTTAEEFAKEFAADSKAETKYSGKSLVLTGEVVSTESWSVFIGVKLKGIADRPVECVFRSNAEQDKKFVPGAKFKMYGEYDGHGTRLTNCELISK